MLDHDPAHHDFAILHRIETVTWPVDRHEKTPSTLSTIRNNLAVSRRLRPDTPHSPPLVTDEMPPFGRTRDMGMYSPLFQTIHDNIYGQQTQNNGPIAARTRSRTRANASKQSPINTHVTASGAIIKARTSARIVERAPKKPARTRAQLKRLLETSPLCRDSDGYIRNSIHDKLLQLRMTFFPRHTQPHGTTKDRCDGVYIRAST